MLIIAMVTIIDMTCVCVQDIHPYILGESPQLIYTLNCNFSTDVTSRHVIRNAELN